jgi:hypothetical protein
MIPSRRRWSAMLAHTSRPARPATRNVAEDSPIATVTYWCPSPECEATRAPTGTVPRCPARSGAE